MNNHDSIVNITKLWKDFFINRLNLTGVTNQSLWKSIITTDSISKKTEFTYALLAMASLSSLESLFSKEIPLIDIHRTYEHLIDRQIKGENNYKSIIAKTPSNLVIGIISDDDCPLTRYIIKCDIPVNDLLVFDMTNQNIYIVEFVNDLNDIPELALIANEESLAI